MPLPTVLLLTQKVIEALLPRGQLCQPVVLLGNYGRSYKVVTMVTKSTKSLNNSHTSVNNFGKTYVPAIGRKSNENIINCALACFSDHSSWVPRVLKLQFLTLVILTPQALSFCG